MFTVTKSYRNLPAAHRQPNHDGHCSMIHGHNWGFDITFTCEKLDENGFVVDVGKLGQVRAYLESFFDHTLLLNRNDPFIDDFVRNIGNREFAEIRIVPNCGMEGLAEFVFNWTYEWARNLCRGRGLIVVRVTCWEDSKNSATYEP